MYFICNENDPNKWPKFFSRSPPRVWVIALSLEPSQGAYSDASRPPIPIESGH